MTDLRYKLEWWLDNDYGYIMIGASVSKDPAKRYFTPQYRLIDSDDPLGWHAYFRDTNNEKREIHTGKLTDCLIACEEDANKEIEE